MDHVHQTHHIFFTVQIDNTENYLDSEIVVSNLFYNINRILIHLIQNLPFLILHNF